MKWFVRADIDGFFGLAMDNLAQLLLIVGLCGHVLGFSDDLIYRHILPGAAVSVLVGNIFYAYQAKRLAALTVAVIERLFIKTALWSGSASLLSALGLMHSYRWTPGETALSLTPAWE